MADTLGDSTSQAALVWSNTLTVLQHNALLTARDKGWFEGVKPEAIFGTTIVLCVSNAETQQALQNELNSPLLTALKICTGKDMFPAFRIVPQSEYQEKAAQNSSNSLSHQAQNNANLNKNKIVTDNTVLPVDNISVSSSNNLSSVTANNSSPVQPDFDHATGISTLQQTDISTEQAAQQKMPVSVQRDAITHLNTCATFDTFVR